MNDKGNGQGTFHYTDGTTLTSVGSGRYQDNVIEGEGVETYDDGSRFEGTFVNGNKV